MRPAWSSHSFGNTIVPFRGLDASQPQVYPVKQCCWFPVYSQTGKTVNARNISRKKPIRREKTKPQARTFVILWLVRVSWHLLWLVITQETFLRYVKRSRFSWPVAGRQLNKVVVVFFYPDPPSLRADVSCAQQRKHLKCARRLWPTFTYEVQR